MSIDTKSSAQSEKSALAYEKHALTSLQDGNIAGFCQEIVFAAEGFVEEKDYLQAQRVASWALAVAGAQISDDKRQLLHDILDRCMEHISKHRKCA